MEMGSEVCWRRVVAEGLGSERVGLDLKKAGNGGSSVGWLVGFSMGGGWPAEIQKGPSM